MRFSDYLPGVNFFSKALRVSFTGSMALSDFSAVAATLMNTLGDIESNKGIILGVAVPAGIVSAFTAACFHGKYGAKHMRQIYTDGYLTLGHGHAHGGDEHHHDEGHAPDSLLLYTLKYLVTAMVRLLQMLLTYCRMYVEIGTVVAFGNMLKTGNEDEILPATDWHAHMAMAGVYIGFFMMYDLWITTQETNEVLCDLLHLHLEKDRLALFFLNTLGLPFKYFKLWRDTIGYHMNILGHTLTHIAFVAELLELMQYERDDILTVSFGVPLLIVSLGILSLIYATTHYFEGLEVYRPNGYKMLGIEDQMPQAPEPGVGLNKILLFPSQLFRLDCMPSLIKNTLGYLSLLDLIHVFHGGDAWLPVIQAGHIVGFPSETLLQAIAAFVFIAVAFCIKYSECETVRYKCLGEAGGPEALPLVAHPVAQTVLQPANHHHHNHGAHTHYVTSLPLYGATAAQQGVTVFEPEADLDSAV